MNASTSDADGVFWSRLDSPLGRLLIVQTATGICRIGFPTEPEDSALSGVAGALGGRVIRSEDATRQVRASLKAYFDGAEVDLRAVPVDFSLVRSSFGRSVLETLRGVSPGEVVTYAQLALRAGYPGAARAVGTAMARNPVPIVVPCHRVVPSTGGIGSYGGGSAMKRWLLELESRRPQTPGRPAPTKSVRRNGTTRTKAPV